MTAHTEASLLEAVHKTWVMGERPHYLVATHVNNGAGFSYNRTLDAIVFNSWPSEGLTLHGLEVKVSKADLRKELQDTSKAQGFIPFLDYFSVVAPKEIIDMDIIPKQWGVYCPAEDGRLRAKRKPLMLHADGNRQDMDRSLAAAFCRALVQRSLSQEACAAAREDGIAEGERRVELELRRAQNSLNELKEAVQQFEEASGVRVRTWNSGRIGKAVKFILDGKLSAKLPYGSDLREFGTKLIALADEWDVLAENLRV